MKQALGLLEVLLQFKSTPVVRQALLREPEQASPLSFRIL